MYNYSKKKNFDERRNRIYGIIQCLKEGMSVKEIAEEYDVSESTIKRDIQYVKKYGLPYNKKN